MAGELSINIEVTVDDALKQMERFRRESSRAATQTAESWNTVLGTNTLSRMNLARAGMAGIGIAIGLGVRATREWARASQDAATEIDGLSAAWRTLQRNIGADVAGSGAIGLAQRTVEAADATLEFARGSAAVGFSNYAKGLGGAMMGSARANLRGDVLGAPRQFILGGMGAMVGDTAIGVNAVNQAREAELAPQRRRDALAQRDLMIRAGMAAAGDIRGAATYDLEREIEQIRRERLRSQQDPGAGGETRMMLDSREDLAYTNYATAMDRALEVERNLAAQVERTAAAERERARAAGEQAEAKQRAAIAGDRDLSFSLRALEIENLRLSGDDKGADIAAERLRFEQLRSDVVNSPNYTGAGRNAALARIDQIEAARLSSVNTPQVQASVSRFQSPGILNSGLAGLGLGRQAFANGQGQTVEVQQLQVLRRIETAVKTNSGARFN